MMSSRPPPADSHEQILAVVRRIPYGRVASYGQVADRAGLPRRARLVGHVLRCAPAASALPWHRVVNAQGRISLAPGSDAYREQRERLEGEGVVFIRGRIDLARYGWQTSLDPLLWAEP